MRRLFFILLLLSPALSGAATVKPSEEGFEAILRTVDLVFADSFARADLAVAAIEDTLPGRPLYHLLYSSILHARMMDGEDFSREKEFMKNVDLTLKALDRWLEKNPRDAWAHFFMGSAYGYMAVWQGQKGSWFKAMLTGMKAKGKFSDAIKLDPTLYDCYTGIGSYHYWSSVKLRKIFPFLSDNRKEGLKELRLAVDSSYISSKPASVGYAWALFNERKYAEALKIAHRLKDETNGARNALWLLGGIYWGNGNLKRSGEHYGLLVKSLERADDQNYYNLIYCRYRLGVCLFAQNNYPAARREFETLLAYKVSKEVRERHKKTYEKAKEHLEKIEKAAPTSGKAMAE